MSFKLNWTIFFAIFLTYNQKMLPDIERQLYHALIQPRKFSEFCIVIMSHILKYWVLTDDKCRAVIVYNKLKDCLLIVWNIRKFRVSLIFNMKKVFHIIANTIKFFMWSPLVWRHLSTTFCSLYFNRHITHLHVKNSGQTSACSFHCALTFCGYSSCCFSSLILQSLLTKVIIIVFIISVKYLNW